MIILFLKRFKRQIRFLFILFLIGTFFLGGYLLYLDQKIGSKFEYHRWNLPSRVYSDAGYLYKGQNLSPTLLKNKLMALGYKNISSPNIQSSGEFHQEKGRLLIYLHDFAYPHEDFKGFPVYLSWSGNRIDQITRLDNRKTLTTLKLEPELVASLFDEKMEDRTLVKLKEIPAFLPQAVIAIEDERFYQHHGIDPISILRALLTDLVKGKLAQGGSTLTQQLVKNFFLTSEKSFIRKFNEMLMAILLEKHYSKDEIMEAYLNEIYLGQKGPASITGVGEASRFYFSKEIGQIDIAEAALLAGMIQAP
ncbi:MAG: transglycosylase domain-containing protein, partial [bacterium]|nr:transglycosylase domain-containing protein [bacterium]